MPNSPMDIGLDAVLPVVASWLLTYALHSTLLIGAVWLIDRRRSLAMVTRDALWKFATVGALVTATAQLGLGLRPFGELRLPGAAPAPVSVPDSRVEQPDPLPPMTLARDDVKAARFEDVPAAVSPAQDRIASGPADLTMAPVDPRAPAAIPWRAVVLLAWLVVALGGLMRLGAARLRLYRIMRTRRPITDPFLLAVTDRLARRAKLRESVALTWSSDVPAPAAFAREICLPKRALATFSEHHLRGIIAHELAHIARRDVMWFGMGLLIERIFFFQPLNFVARRRLQESAEYLCDDWAVGQTGQPLTLAECLAEVAEWIQHAGRPLLAPSMAEQGSRLVRRVQRILHTTPGPGPVPLRRMSWGPVSLGVAVTLFAPGVAPFDAADESEAEREAPVVSAMEDAAPDLVSEAVAFESDAVSEAPGALAASVMARPGAGVRTPDFTGLIPARPQERVSVATTPTPVVADPVAVEVAPAAQDTVDPRVIQSLIDALDDEDVVVRREAAAALARLRAVQAIPALTGLLQDTDHDVRRVATAALARMRDERAVNGLVVALRDATPEVRKTAAEGLGPYRTDAAYRGLLTLLGDSEPALRREAILQLEKQERIEAAPEIVRLMRDQEEPVRRAAVWAIGELRYRDATQQLLTATQDSSEDIRYYALRGLVRLEEPAARPALARALEDPSAKVRAVAARALGEYGDSTNVPALIRAAADPDGDVREYALRALREIGDARAAAAYTTALRDTEGDVREAAIRGIAELGNETAVPALASQLDTSLPRQIRETATRALINFRSTDAVDALMTALRDPDAEVRQVAVAGLGRIRDVRALTPLVNALNDEEPDVREQAIRALAEFKSATTVEPFINALGDESADVRALAARALGALRDPRAVDPLISALEDPDTSVRRAAVRALAQFPGRQ